MSSREIKQILFEMSRDDKDFPIFDLAKIIADYVYEIPTKCVQTLSGHNDAIWSLIELKDGRLVSGSLDTTIKIWGKNAGIFKDREKTCFSSIQTLSEHTRAITSLVELKDGSFASGSYDHTINIWGKNASIFGKQQVGSTDWLFAQTLTGHDDAIQSLIELKDGSLASGSYDNTIKIWRDGRCVQTLSGHNEVVSLLIELKDGSLVSGSEDRTIKIWGKNAGIFEEKKCIQTLSEHTHNVSSLIELKDGLLASGSWDNTIKIWDKKQVGSDNWVCVQTLSGHNDAVSSLIELKDGSLTSGSYDKTIKIWRDGRCVQTLSGHSDAVSLLIELKDGSLASGSYDNTIKIWS